MSAADCVSPNTPRIQATRGPPLLVANTRRDGGFQSMRVPEFAVSRTKRLRGVEDGMDGFGW